MFFLEVWALGCAPLRCVFLGGVWVCVVGFLGCAGLRMGRFCWRFGRTAVRPYDAFSLAVLGVRGWIFGVRWATDGAFFLAVWAHGCAPLRCVFLGGVWVCVVGFLGCAGLRMGRFSWRFGRTAVRPYDEAGFWLAGGGLLLGIVAGGVSKLFSGWLGRRLPVGGIGSIVLLGGLLRASGRVGRWRGRGGPFLGVAGGL